ncbi:uncharacterized protein LOC122301858 [Carya illinoinensis]|uniref:uncharacterized protein LOC122301858 n=1 Tax=Carya illinoinensis TaxID=32201 RepID=UPI001C722A7F|nr:uncharacterized protein LOC122301858 [Carya illinoinensis]
MVNEECACPKDSFLLPYIGLIVDSIADHHLMSFMDAYSGYNRISMYLGDEEKTSFITDRGLYCYTAMSFGLKNAGATYQRLVNQMRFPRPWCEKMMGSKDQFTMGSGVHIITDEGEKHDYTVKLAFKTTNNEVEHEALLLGMTITRSLATGI